MCLYLRLWQSILSQTLVRNGDVSVELKDILLGVFCGICEDPWKDSPPYTIRAQNDDTVPVGFEKLSEHELPTFVVQFTAAVHHERASRSRGMCTEVVNRIRQLK